MPQISLPPDPTRTNVSLDIAGDALPVRLVSDPPDSLDVARDALLVRLVSDLPGDPIPPSERLRGAWSIAWRDKPIRLFLIVAFIVFIGSAIVLAASSYLSLHTTTLERTVLAAELGYTVEYPPRLVAREDEQFSITLVNRSPISLTHVSATLVFSDALSISSDTTVAQFEDLAPGECKTRAIYFTLNQYAVPRVQAELRASADQFGTVPLETYPLNVVPFPWLKTIRNTLGGLSALLGGILLWMLWDVLKDMLSGK